MDEVKASCNRCLGQMVREPHSIECLDRNGEPITYRWKQYYCNVAACGNAGVVQIPREEIKKGANNE